MLLLWHTRPEVVLLRKTRAEIESEEEKFPTGSEFDISLKPWIFLAKIPHQN